MSLNRYTGGFSRPMYNLNASPHIFFTKPDDRDYHNFESYFNSENHSKVLYLFNPSYKFNFFDYLPKHFTINTLKPLTLNTMFLVFCLMLAQI